MKQPTPSKIKFSMDGSTSTYRLVDLFYLLFNNLEDGVMLLAPDGSLIKANAACLDLFEIESHEIRKYSKSPMEHYVITDLDGNTVPAASWPTMRVLNKELFKDEEYIIRKKGNIKGFYASISGKPELDKQGKLIMGILFIRDVSEQINTRKKLKEELDRSIQHDIDLKHYQLQLENDRHLLRTIIDTIPVMITIYDNKIDRVILNKAVENITGWTKADTEETGIMDLAYPDPDYRKEISGFMQSKQTGFKDIIMRTRDGRDIQTSWANVTIADGRKVGVGIDITQRKKLEAELIRAKKKAERENQVQTSFIQNISHEVRTPMNSILGFTELLQKSIKDGKEKEYLNSITVNGKQLLSLIEDIVDFSRLDKNEMPLAKEHVHIDELAEHIKSQFPGLKRRYKKIGLKLLLQDQQAGHNNIFLHTDRQRIHQVFTNLISNAVKYTQKGSIKVGYHLNEDAEKIVFWVKDTGIGISKDNHERVFSRFNRFHDTSTTDFRGTGLGLAISKHLINLMDGEIWFKSKLGEGSTFYFSHPFTKMKNFIKQEEAKASTNQNKMPQLKGRTILIAEDDEYSFQMMKGMLEDTGAEILHANNGDIALEMFSKNDPDFVFLDIRLPQKDGYQIIKEIRKVNKEIPVIAQTANALPEDKEKSFRAGFDHHATKPLSISKLYNLLNTYF